MGHVPSVDLSFSEDEEIFVRDTYLFKSILSKKLHLDESLQEVLDESECIELDVPREIRRVREYTDFSKAAINDECEDQFV